MTQKSLRTSVLVVCLNNIILQHAHGHGHTHTHTQNRSDQLPQTYHRELSTITGGYNRIDNTETMKIPYNCLNSLCIYIISKQYTSIFHHCGCKQATEMYINKTLFEIKYINPIHQSTILMSICRV
jgi:hypothetical protein